MKEKRLWVEKQEKLKHSKNFLFNSLLILCKIMYGSGMEDDEKNLYNKKRRRNFGSC